MDSVASGRVGRGDGAGDGREGSMVEFGQVDFGQSEFPSLRADFGSDFSRIRVQIVRWTLAKTKLSPKFDQTPDTSTLKLETPKTRTPNLEPLSSTPLADIALNPTRSAPQ